MATTTNTNTTTTTSSTTTPPPPCPASDTATTTAITAEALASKTVQKRYEGLVMVRTKAIKGKGAWYWAHLEPMLVQDTESGLPKAVKLRCLLCDAVFSASNPSRTASEHLKRGTCPNFNSSNASTTPAASKATVSSPIATTPPPPHASLASPTSSTRKRSASSSSSLSPYPLNALPPACTHSPLSVVEPFRFSGDVAVTPHHHHQLHHQRQQHHHHHHHQHPQQHLVLSGGKDDLGALALLEDSVKKLKSPKTSPGPSLSKTQVESALEFLADWVYESCGSVSFSSIEHPKFKAFLKQVGLPPVSRRELVGVRLDVKFEEAKAESEVKIRDAMFFQIGSDGWKFKSLGGNLVNLALNLPNGTSVYRKAVYVTSSVPSKYAEEILWETISDVCGNSVQQCVGIVADRFKAKALRSLENQHPWMVNLSCQFQGFLSLIKDFHIELPLFKIVRENCFKLANFVNDKMQVQTSFHKYQLQEYGYTGLLRVPRHEHENVDFEPVYSMLEDILCSARALQLVLSDESYKIVAMEDPTARDISEMVGDVGFWNDLEAVHSLVKLIKDMAREIEIERPLVGQCMPLWNEFRSKARDWCMKFHIAEGAVEKVIEKRFKKNYHPAWAAAYILDPLYLICDNSGKYLPPFKYLSAEQEKDVDKLITRLVSREEAHVALMELMKWRTEGLDPVYAKAVQMKERDPITGKMKIAIPKSSRLVWETYLTDFKSLGKVAVRLIFLHATSCGFKCNWSLLRWVCTHAHQRVAIDKVQKLIFIAAHSKLERREFISDEDKDAELFALASSEDDMLNEVFVDTSSV